MLDDDDEVEDGVDDDVGQGFDGDGDDSMVSGRKYSHPHGYAIFVWRVCACGLSSLW